MKPCCGVCASELPAPDGYRAIRLQPEKKERGASHRGQKDRCSRHGGRQGQRRFLQMPAAVRKELQATVVIQGEHIRVSIVVEICHRTAKAEQRCWRGSYGLQRSWFKTAFVAVDKNSVAESGPERKVRPAIVIEVRSVPGNESIACK